MTGYDNEPDARYRLMDGEFSSETVSKESEAPSEGNDLKMPDFDKLIIDEKPEQKKVQFDVDNLTEHVMMMDPGKPEDVKKDSDKKKKRRLTSQETNELMSTKLFKQRAPGYRLTNEP